MSRVRPLWLGSATATALMVVALLAVTAVAAQQGTPAAKPAVPATKPSAGVKAAPKGTPVRDAAATNRPPVQPAAEQILYLIRSTLLTLNDANRSGNYTVLRDLASPGFRTKYSAAELALSFTDLRRRKFDLFGVALLAPQLTAAPEIDDDGRLRLSGVFPTRPLQIKFDLIFEVDTGHWKLFGIAIATPDAPPLPAQTQGPQGSEKSATQSEPAKLPAWMSTVTR